MKTDFKSEMNKKPLFVLAAVLVIFVTYLLFKFVQKNNSDTPVDQGSLTAEKTNPAVNLTTAKPIDLVANSKSEGPLVAKMNENTTLEDLEKAIKFLPDGESFSLSVYAGADKVEILRIDKAKGKIRSVYIDGDYVEDLVGEQSSFNWSEYFVKQAKAFSVYDSFGDQIEAVSDDLTIEEQVAALKDMLQKILLSLNSRGNKNLYPVISVSGTPSVGISATNYVNRCVSSGGTWEGFSSLSGSDLKGNACSSLTDASIQSKLSVLNNSTSYKGSHCSCPSGQCLNLEELSERGRYDSSGYSTVFELRGYCSGGSSIVNPPIAATNCTSSGGIWTEAGDSLTKYSYCTCPTGYRLRGEKCQSRGAGIHNCNVGQVNIGRFIGRQSSCFDLGNLESNCKNSNGSWIEYGMDNSGSLAESNPPSRFCGRTEKAFFKQNNCDERTDARACTATAYPYFGCACPTDYCLNAESKCVPDTYSDNETTDEKLCTESGGTWKQFSNIYNANRERCDGAGEAGVGVTLWKPVNACDCPTGKCLSSEQKCVAGDSDQGACEKSGGVWRDAIDAPEYSYCECSGDPEVNLAPHVRTVFPITCSQPKEVDCGTDKQCFYNHVQKNTKAKLRIVEVNYFDNYRTEESSQIQTGPKSGSSLATEIVMTVSSLKKIDEAPSSMRASGVVSDNTLKNCPNLINNLSQLDGKSATCTVNNLSQAKALVENGLTLGSIARYSCSGGLLDKIREICGTYPDMVVKKPAVYLYPTQDTQVEVSLDINGEVVKSEPEYPVEGWTVKATPSGLIDGRYDYLFYENTLNKIDLPKEGWVVKYDNLSKWFDYSLPKLGLNEKEKAQFKEYWLNELKPAKFYEIKLLSDRFLAENMKLKVSPEPKTVIRRNFIFKPLDQRKDIKEPNIITPKREGFTVVEWGGVEIR